MANYTATRSKQAILTANVVDTITLDRAYSSVEIINWDTAAKLMAVIVRGAGNEQNADPTVQGDGCWVIGPGAVRIITDDVLYGTPTPASVVKLISATACTYSVTGLS